jgi:hypothetical protein
MEPPMTSPQAKSASTLKNSFRPPNGAETVWPPAHHFGHFARQIHSGFHRGPGERWHDPHREILGLIIVRS